MRTEGKNVVVLGLGTSGMAAASLLRRDGANVVVRDEADGPQLESRAESLRKLGVHVELSNRFDRSARFDFAVLSPGIDRRRPIVREIDHGNLELLSELELAYRFCQCPIVAITGTNGKTTTTELVASLLGYCGRKTIAAGNIGLAFSEAVTQSEELDLITLEVSSFQLEEIQEFRPAVSVLLNITPDHLDRYSSLEQYAAAKWRIFMNQQIGDFAVMSVEALEILERLGKPIPARMITFSAWRRSGDLWLDGHTVCGQLRGMSGEIFDLSETKLGGRHNAENILAALGVGYALGLPLADMVDAILAYEPRPHRCEFVATIRGVTFINDSKATNPDAVEKALRAMTAPVILIAGGRDKNFDFSTVKEVVHQKVKLAVVLGEAQEKICQAWSEATPCVRVFSMAEAVDAAAERASAGDVVLLSPGCASFDMFDNYAHRGDTFKRLVMDLQ
jgi:UDP-N-acetylmuramoylalanine--D-glutamate ligase